MRHLQLLSTLTIVIGTIVVLAGSFGWLSGVWLIAGVGLVLAGIVKAIVFSIWSGTTA